MSATSRYKPPPIPAAELAAIRRRITALREAAGLSPESLAAAAGLSRSAVRLIEGGQSSPALGTLYALAAALELPVSALISGPKNKSGKY